ncbi:hypothetical protein [Desulfosporosinus sp. Sb-LF]|nr:hypothetical protein [Desulfosporosinus sp. Sb-LF]
MFHAQSLLSIHSASWNGDCTAFGIKVLADFDGRVAVCPHFMIFLGQ